MRITRQAVTALRTCAICERSMLVGERLGDSRKPAVEPVVDEPILRRLSEPELAMVEAADLFNESAFRRTIAGIAKSLGEPQASIVPLSGTNNEVVVSVAWDISWYQYRV